MIQLNELIMTTATQKTAHWCYGDYVNWPEDQRWELIDGIAYNMAPAPSFRHQEVVTNIIFLFKNNICNPACHIITSPIDVLLTAHDNTKDETDDILENKVDTVVQPDVLVLCDENKIAENCIRGAPDLIVEVLSPATAKKDEGIKRDLYERVGVHEYWLVHPVDHTINRYSHYNNIYNRSDVFGLGDSVTSSRFPELVLTLSQVFGVEPEAVPQPG